MSHYIATLSARGYFRHIFNQRVLGMFSELPRSGSSLCSRQSLIPPVDSLLLESVCPDLSCFTIRRQVTKRIQFYEFLLSSPCFSASQHHLGHGILGSHTQYRGLLLSCRQSIFTLGSLRIHGPPSSLRRFRISFFHE